MELRQLQYFLAAAQERHFTRAAKRMNVVQSALSSAIQGLENELGCQLFSRSTRSVKLTPAGEAFRDRAKQAIALLEQAKTEISDFDALARGTLTIGTVQTLSAFLDLPALLDAFHKRHPRIEIRLRQGNRANFVQQICQGDVDLAIVPTSQRDLRVETRTVVDQPLVLLCSRGAPFAKRAKVTLEEISNSVFIEFQPGWGTRDLIDAAFADQAIQRRIGFEVSELDTLIGLVRRGLGVALVPKNVADRSTGNLVSIPLSGSVISWKMEVAYPAARKGYGVRPTQATQAFLDLLHASVEHKSKKSGG